MTYNDRSAHERFLAEVHVGVLSVADTTGTIATPIWYRYEPGGSVEVLTTTTSRKGRAIRAAGRFGVTAQVETVPYRYVSVEGPVVETRPAELERDLVPMAVRYLGPDFGERYAALWRDAGIEETSVFALRPERWFAADLTDELAAFASETSKGHP
jgi:nitroimidazol reductase NimA-like FMN-containing flavoprotein (pyridoxamine 5'-phosphate oxidase superfamily)